MYRYELLGRAGTALGTTRVALALQAAAVFSLVFTLGFAAARFKRQDFSIFYAASTIERSGGNPYRVDLARAATGLGMDTEGVTHIPDTPTFIMLLSPLSAMRPATAYFVWTTINLAALVISLYLLLSGYHLEPSQAVSLAAIAFLYPPVAHVFIWGQWQTAILLLLVVAFKMLEVKRDTMAGVAVGIAALLRAFPLLLAAYFLLRRRWNALTGMGLAIALGTAITIAIVGVERYVDWVELILRKAQTDDRLTFNIGLAPFVSRMFWYGFGAWPGHLAVASRWAVTAVGELLIVGAAFKCTPLPPERDDGLRAFAVWVAAMIILSPIAWAHFMPVLLIAFLPGLRRLMRGTVNGPAVMIMMLNFVLAFIWTVVWFSMSPPDFHTWKLVFTEMGFAVMLTGFVSACLFARKPELSQAMN